MDAGTILEYRWCCPPLRLLSSCAPSSLRGGTAAASLLGLPISALPRALRKGPLAARHSRLATTNHPEFDFHADKSSFIGFSELERASSLAPVPQLRAIYPRNSVSWLFLFLFFLCSRFFYFSVFLFVSLCAPDVDARCIHAVPDKATVAVSTVHPVNDAIEILGTVESRLILQ